MKVLLFGASGMVGQAALQACLAADDVREIVAVVRTPLPARYADQPKLRTVVHADFLDFTAIANELDADACLWCLGVTSAGMTEPDYTRVTHDFTLAAARAVPHPAAMTFVFVSGTGADGAAMWARVKRKTEEDLAGLPFRALFIFRPGMIEPRNGIRSRTRMYNILYPLLWPLVQLTKLLRPSAVTNTDRVGRAMLHVVRSGHATPILYNRDINAAGAAE